MTITLPDEWRERLEALAKMRGFSTIDECLQDLVLHDLAHDAETSSESPDVVDSQLAPRNRQELEEMLDEGMKSGGIVEADEVFWAERRRILLKKYSQKTETSQ